MDVVLVRWPEEDTRLQQLREDGSPRLLLLNGESGPPESEEGIISRQIRPTSKKQR